MPDTDRHLSEFAALISLATHTLNTYTNDADLCAVCGCACQNWNGPASTPTEATVGPALHGLATPMRGGGGR